MAFLIHTEKAVNKSKNDGSLLKKKSTIGDNKLG